MVQPRLQQQGLPEVTDGEISAPLVQGDAPQLHVGLGAGAPLHRLQQEPVQLGYAPWGLHLTSRSQHAYPVAHRDRAVGCAGMARLLQVMTPAPPADAPADAPPSAACRPALESNMARSLQTKHTEKLGTSSLLNAFLVLAFACLLLASMVSASTAGGADTPPATAPESPIR